MTFYFKIIIAFTIALLCNQGLSQITPDPGLTGPYSVTKLDYDLGDLAFDPISFTTNVEVRGSVHFPTGLTGGPYPVIVFLHGRHETCFETANPSNTSMDWPCPVGFESITSFEGYDYLGQFMASHGYIVISVSANAINADDNSYSDYGMQARAELVQHHLDLWNGWNTVSSAPFDSLFIGKLDLNMVGTMGHSRGGEGVVRHELLNRSLGSPYGVKAILTLAPVDFLREIIDKVPLMNVSPYCDGDVSDLQGVHFYDDSRFSDTSSLSIKHNVVMMGANHNFFNTVWTPGLYPAGGMDDWDDIYGNTQSFCGSSATDSRRFDPTTQQAVLKAYLSAFFRIYIGNETVYKPILEVDDIIPPTSALVDSNQVFVSYHPQEALRMDINRTNFETMETINTLSGTVSQTGLVTYDICGDDASEADCGLSMFNDKEPHSGSSSALGMGQLQIEWDNFTDNFTNEIPLVNADISNYGFIQFRTAVDFANSTSGSDVNFVIQLEDYFGNTASCTASNYTNALYFPPGSQFMELPKAIFHTIKIPLNDFPGIDLTQVKFVKFNFSANATGAILVTDISATGVAQIITSNTTHNPFDSYSVYPNPTSNFVNVNTGKIANEIENISIFDINGKLIQSIVNYDKHKLTIDLSEYQNGFYFLSIGNKYQRKTFKLIKQ